MAVKDTWRRALEYFGLVEGDYIEEGEYEEGDTGTDMALDDTAVAPREPVRSMPARRRGRDDDIDDIFGDEEPAPRRGRLREVEEPAPAPRRGRRRSAAPAGNGGGVSS
ncbi:MAG TPA: hypothetical protein VFT14_03015, partial [Solirubrobacterales bacterium]|nr:hypothetical protein [Solirubrobacterales bacterium]